MSHADTTLDLAPGLTVICGPNNCGKSAVVSAIETVCSNASGDFMVRHGTDASSVTIETTDDCTITWRRKKNVVSYVINGREVHRLSGAVPADLHEHLKLDRIETKNGPFDVHLGKQKEPIFLINREADAAAFFSSADDSEHLLRMQKRHKAKVAEKRAVEKAHRATLIRCDTELASMSSMDAIGKSLESVETEYAKVVESIDLEKALGAFIQKLQGRTQLAQHARAQEAVLGLPVSVPVLADERALWDVIQKLFNAAAAATAIESRRRVLANLEEPPACRQTDAFARLVEKFQATQSERATFQTRLDALRELHEPPTIEDPKSLIDLGRRLKSGIQKWDASVEAVKVFNPMPDVPAMQEMSPLQQLLKSLERLQTEQAAIRSTLKAIDAEILFHRTEIEEWVAEHPLCPLCGGPTNVEHALASEVAHG